MGLSQNLSELNQIGHRARERKHMSADAQLQVEILAQLRMLNEQIAWQNRVLSTLVEQHPERRSA